MSTTRIDFISNISNKKLFEYLCFQYPSLFTFHPISKDVIVDAFDVDKAAQFLEKTSFLEVVNQIMASNPTIDISCLMANTFALEAWVLSVTIRVPCVIVHPTPPYCPPDLDNHHKNSVLSWLKAAYPELYYSSRRSEKAGTRIDWSTFSLWLWPILVDCKENIDMIAGSFTLSARIRYRNVPQQRGCSISAGGWFRFKLSQSPF